MVEADDSSRVDQDVAPLLHRIGAWQTREPPLQRFTPIGPHRRDPPEMTPSGTVHAIRGIQPSLGIYQQRPAEPGLLEILPRVGWPFEGDDERNDVEPVQLCLRPLQLQQMSTTGQSEQMPVEDQQHPATTIVCKSMLAPGRVGQVERDSRLADQGLCHGTCRDGRRGERTTAVPPFGMHGRWSLVTPELPSYRWTNLWSAGLTVSATQMSPLGAIVM